MDKPAKHIAALTRAYRNAKTLEAKEKLRVKIKAVQQAQDRVKWLGQ